MNQAKCAMLVKLCGREAQSVLQKHTCWLPDTAGVLQRHWRLGQRLHTGKNPRLNTSASKSPMAASKSKHCAAASRKQPRNSSRSGDSSTIADMRGHGPVWFTTVWATLVTGLPEVGLTEETARLLRGWYAHSAPSLT